MGEDKKTAGRQALYRKYRGKTLDDIKGQTHITQTLKNSLLTGNISHAYLFTGPHGVGKTSVARILAHQLNNLAYTDESIHVDIIEIDAASNRRIDDIRDLRDKVRITPISAAYKVYIIDEVHMLTPESFNALLKTLEEPPAHAIFILATTELHKLPSTIISRTQRHSFKAVPLDEIFSHLSFIAQQEKIDIAEAALRLLAEHGRGSFRDSISLLDQISAHTQRIELADVELLLGRAPTELITELLSQSSPEGQPARLLELTSQLLEAGSTALQIAEQLASLVRGQLTEQPDRLERYTQLIDGLLEVATARYPRMKLEVVLLKQLIGDRQTSLQDEVTAPPHSTLLATPINSPSPSLTIQSPALAAQPAEPKVRMEVTAEVKVEAPAAAAAGAKTKTTRTNRPKSASSKAVGATNIKDWWPEALAATKARNNSLYTVLRLAEPHFKDGQLELRFGFSFHQKRANDSKNKSLIHEVVNQFAEVNSVSMVVDAAAKPPSATTPTKPQKAATMDDIKQMMGGGEVVDVQ